MTSLTGFPVVGFRSSIPLDNAWNVTHSESVRIKLDRAGRTVLRAEKESSVYLILGGDARDFKMLRTATGIETDADTALAISLDVTGSERVRAEIHLLEYDADGKRTGVTKIGAQRSVLYLAPAAVAKVLVTIRIRGCEDLRINSLEIDQARRPSNVSAAVKVVEYDRAQPKGPRVVRDAIAEVETSLDEAIGAGRRLRSLLGTVRDQSPADSDPAVASGDSGSSLAARRMTRDLLIELASTLPTSNGSEYYAAKLPFHVAIITDEYMLNFYRDVFERVTYVSPQQVDEVIAEGFDLLLYVTCWKGLADEEWRGIKFREAPATALNRLLAYARANGKTTLFQSIEDPSNFEYFLPVARLFDVVFTSDSESIPAYREELGHDRILYGEYGANPQLNNPIGSYRHTINKAFFAGSYPKRYQDRVDDMRVMFRSVLATGENLTLVDRNFGNEEYAFPPEFERLALEPMPHDVLQRVHKLFRWSLNFNSIKSSPTMCAMRVYELQAQGRGLLSNYARSVFNKFPEVRIVADVEKLSSYFSDEIGIVELVNNEAQVRSILTDRTAFDIAERMLVDAEVLPGAAERAPEVLLLVEAPDDRLVAQIADQSYPNVRLVESGATSLEEVAASGARYIGRVSAAHDYGRHYVTDRINAFKYTDSAFVTQEARVVGGRVEGKAHEYAAAAAEDLTIFSVRRVGEHGVSALLAGEDPGAAAGYALPPFEAAPRRPGDDSAPAQATDWRPELSIIVPVFNAGRFLETKCLPSIDRNQRSDEFEILIVDDGSTDGVTPGICRAIAARDSRIVLHCFETGGSGSASRPRNWGLSHARGRRVAFLDPDNEISDGGYDTLLTLLDEAQSADPGVGFVSGYQAKVTQRTGTTGRHTQERLVVYPDLRAHFFGRGKFPVVSTQAAVMENRLFEDGSLRFVERAAGQDTLFGWELLLAAGRGAFTADAHLIYYAERDGSVTNSVDTRYFEKKLIMEQAQVEALRRHELLDVYREHHFRNFLTNWYLPKLEHVDEANRGASTEILREIVRLYDVEPEF